MALGFGGRLARQALLWSSDRVGSGAGSTMVRRTPSTMRSDAAFETANKAAAPLAGAGGAVLAVCGVLAAVLPRHLFGAFVFGGVGVFLVLCLLGAVTGVRASRSVP